MPCVKDRKRKASQGWLRTSRRKTKDTRLCRAGWSSEVAIVPLGSGGCGGMEETVRLGSQAGKRGQEILNTDHFNFAK